MSLLLLRNRFVALPLVAGAVLSCLAGVPPRGNAAQFGGLTGTVTDTQGDLLMGATILLVGPASPDSHGLRTLTLRVITDARGRYKVDHLLPGRYSLRVTSLTRLPALKEGVRVEPNQTSQQNVVLEDIFAPIRLQVPQGSVTTWGQDWKWVLRTSGTTRPVLRYQEAPRKKASGSRSSRDKKATRPPGEYLMGMVPGSGLYDPLSNDQGMGSVLAYLRPLSADSDFLVAGSLDATGVQSGSLATVFRRNILNGDPQEIAVVVHQLSFSEGLPLPSANAANGFDQAQGITASYKTTRRLSDRLTLTTGVKMNYLNSIRSTATARPLVHLQYQMRPNTEVNASYGAIGLDEGGGTLLDRVGELNAFPRVTLSGYRPELEQVIHGEVNVEHRFTKYGKVVAAAYQDSFENRALWGFAGAGTLMWLSGSVLPNPAGNGWTLNAGSYRSSGFRVGYSEQLGRNVEAEVAYSTGDALAAKPAETSADETGSVRGLLRTAETQTVGAKVSARLPATKTRVVTSYGWLPGGRVTSVDPYGEVRPNLDLEIRQALPSIAFLPAHFEAVADFQNMLAQGYVPLARRGDNPLVLTAAYRYFRGGFSVQF